MRIVKNTSGRDTRFIRSVFTKVHNHMKKLERRSAPNWKGLRVKIQGRERNYAGGRAFYNGNGWKDWDLFLTIPRPVRKGTDWASGDTDKGKPNVYRVRSLAWLVYHELMHTYGYDHSQFSDITDAELEKLFPENVEVPAEQPKVMKEAAAPVWRKRYENALAAEKRWVTKQKRANNALKKVRAKIKYYERTYEMGDD